MRNVVWALAVALSLVLAAGCGGAGTGGRSRASGGGAGGSGGAAAEPAAPLVSFPSRDELASLVASAGSATVPSAGTWVADWEMEPFDVAEDGGDPLAPSAHLAAIEGELVAQRPGSAAGREARCAAREMARFIATHGGLPTEALRNFVSGRCGIVAPTTTLSAQLFEVRGRVTAEQVLAGDARARVIASALRSMPSQALDFGAAFVVVGGSAAFVAVGAPHGAEVRARIEGTDAVLEGRAGTPGALLAIANRGTHGVALCGVAPEGESFRARCPFEAHEGRTWVDVVAQPPQSVMFQLVARVLVVSDPVASLRYHVRSFAPLESAPAEGESPAATFAREATELVSRVRTEVGLSPLTLASPQSEANAQLATLVAAGLDAQAAERALLGAMAGWELGVPVRDGRAVVGVVVGDADAARWLAEALDSPLARWTLLDPTMEIVAVGAAPHEGVTAVLATTYVRHDDAAIGPVAQALQDHIAARRAAAGLPPARFTRARELERAAQRIQRGEAGVQQAAEDAMHEAAARIRGRGIRAYSVQTMLPAVAPLPDEMVLAPRLEIAIQPVPHRVAGTAWVQWAILVLSLD